VKGGLHQKREGGGRKEGMHRPFKWAGKRYTRHHHYINNVHLPLFQTADLIPALLRNNFFADVEQFIILKTTSRSAHR
jgi:hypothetical protein